MPQSTSRQNQRIANDPNHNNAKRSIRLLEVFLQTPRSFVKIMGWLRLPAAHGLDCLCFLSGKQMPVGQLFPEHSFCQLRNPLALSGVQRTNPHGQLCGLLLLRGITAFAFFFFFLQNSLRWANLLISIQNSSSRGISWLVRGLVHVSKTCRLVLRPPHCGPEKHELIGRLFKRSTGTFHRTTTLLFFSVSFVHLDSTTNINSSFLTTYVDIWETISSPVHYVWTYFSNVRLYIYVLLCKSFVFFGNFLLPLNALKRTGGLDKP